MIVDEHFRNAEVVRVKDGDTIVAMVDLGFSVWTKQTFRYYGIDAPEKNTPAGRVSQTFMRVYMPPGTKLVLEIIRNPSGKLSRTFDRYVCIPYKKGVNVCEMMVKRKYARRWAKYKRFKKS